ncbi:6-phosphofructokinase [Odoribacter lunatus]|uniref:6-phosphofructokinase n=1 Tax=Odoribacter lunatus TaxID=2941335 RepID=UPI00203EC6D9|nr:6-phosphofructokinase [Odoribacter lunatus]
MKTIAILCGGGPAPGINTVVATVAKVFLKAGYRVLGIHEGYKGLLKENPEIEELTFDKADWIFTQGGSLLKMSRFKPKDEDFNVRLFVQYGIELLVTIGGDDTASTANRLTKFLAGHEIQVRNIHVPKTIDNDLPLPEGVPTFGFMSAKEMGIRIGKIVKTEAATTQNWYLLMSMGREAGHLAFEIGKGIQASTVIIPEMFQKTQITVDKIVRLIISAMVKRRIMGQKSGVAVVSEGIFHFLKDEDIAASGIVFEYDAHGHPELSDVGKAHILNKILRNHLRQLGLDIISRPVEVGYSLRCVEPCAYDLTYCTTLGIGVKKLFDAGCSGCMVAVDINRNIIPVYLSDIEDEHGKIRTRLVNMQREEIRTTFTDMVYCLTPEDREAARAYLPSPEEYEWETILEK